MVLPRLLVFLIVSNYQLNIVLNLQRALGKRKMMRRMFSFTIFATLLSSYLNVANAGQSKIYVVNGDITNQEYKGFEQFLFNSLDTVIGLKISFTLNTDYKVGELSADANNGQFVAYLTGPNNESEIVATEGYQYLHGDYVFDGFFIVKSGGMHQGVISLYLQKTDEAQVRLSRAKLVDIRAERLNAKYKKKL